MLSATYFSPGRVNLIGEHIDYNGGLVLPIALNIGITTTFKKNHRGTIILSSSTHPFSIELPITEIPETYSTEKDWCNYPIGVINTLQQSGLAISEGFDLHFNSNLPEGSGLSSSAAIEVATAYILLHQAGKEINLPDLAKLCKAVENNFIGVNCGIMDQFAVANCQKDNALLLNCNTLKYQLLPFEFDGYSLLILNSKKPRSLIKSAYNERKAESEEALRILINAKKLKEGDYLVDADVSDLTLIADNTIMKRARHVVTENIRVRHAAKALEMGDLFTFGRLMNASHQSLKEDYEVTGFELDTLAETAQNIDGCIGARMTGAGFGGCAIAIVRKNAIENFIRIISNKYKTATDLLCEIYECKAEDGVKLIA